jgi:hypothetical protein
MDNVKKVKVISIIRRNSCQNCLLVPPDEKQLAELLQPGEVNHFD